MLSALPNIIATGLLTGLVYGLAALGLSVIFGVVRVVNFAHGEIMVFGMYGAVLLEQGRLALARLNGVANLDAPRQLS